MEAPVKERTRPTLPRTTRAWCLFEAGGGRYAIGLEMVAEVVELERLVRLPSCQPRVLGLCALRRDVIPVFRIGPEGEPPEGPDGERKHVLILRTSRGVWAIEIHAEGTVVAEEPLDATKRPGDVDDAVVVLGTVPRGEAVYTAIDPEATWWRFREAVDDWYAHYWDRGEPEAAHTARAV